MNDPLEHNPTDHEDPLAGPTWTIGIIGMVLLAVTVLAVAAVFYDVDTAERQIKIESAPTSVVEQLKAEQRLRLTGMRRERRADGEEAVVIPIDLAMELMVLEAEAPTD